MKKTKIFKAVVATIVVLCSVLFSSCSDDYSNGADKSVPVLKDSVKVASCEVTLNTYEGAGAVTTRSTAVENLDGKLTAVSRHKAVFSLGGDSLTEYSYSGTNTIEARGVYKPRYAKSLESFKEQNLKMKDQIFDNGRSGKFISFQDGANHNFYYAFLLTQEYERGTLQVENPLTGKKETKKLCINEIVSLEFLSQRVTDLERDSAGWHAYSLVHSYAGMMSEGPNNGFQYDINIPLVWVWNGTGENPEFPNENPDIIVWEDGEQGIDQVNDSIDQSWRYIIPTLSDGTKGKPDRIAVLLKKRIRSPKYQIKQVDDLAWNELELQSYDEVTNGEPYEKENSIFVTPFIKTIKTRTDKCECIFPLEREGRPVFVDSLGGQHRLPDCVWVIKKQSWTGEDMEPTENFKRKLLTSTVAVSYNERDLEATGQVELRMIKGADVELVGYEYKNFDIKAITPNVLYYSYVEQWAVFSNNKTEKVGEIGTNLNINTVSPEKQEVIVTDWDIKDLDIQKFNATRQSSRKDTISTGVFTITPFAKKNTTRTNKSVHNFVTTYDGDVVFKDKFGNEVTFPALDPSFADNGGVNTLKNLLEENDYERKLMTSTLAVTAYGSDVSTHAAEVIFKKVVEKEELLDWSITNQDLAYKGNALWTSSTTITYVWKLAGSIEKTYSADLIWGIEGESKSQVILDEAKADYSKLNEGSETTSTTENGNITIVTKKKGYVEDYTSLKDNYTATMQTASYESTVDGKKIAFDFLAPTGMTVAHADGTLVNGNRTTTLDGIVYDVWDHTGSVTATVTSSKGNQTETATDKKEVLIKKADSRPKTDYDVAGLERYFVISKVKNSTGWADAVMFLTKTHVFTVIDSYNKDGKFTGRSTDMVERSRVIVNNNVNSIVYDSQTNHYVPALTVSDHKGWNCEGFIDGRSVVCDRYNQQAIDEGIKNFVGSGTSVPTPFISQATSSTKTWQKEPFITVSWKTSTTTGTVTVGSK